MEDYVTFKTAKKLKEKGFNWICSCYYRTRCKDLFMVFPSEDWSDTEERINAPTISQVLKWLRKEKDIFIGILYAPMSNKGHMDFYYPSVQKIGYYNRAKYINPKEFYSSYEQAALAGIEYALNNLI